MQNLWEEVSKTFEMLGYFFIWIYEEFIKTTLENPNELKTIITVVIIGIIFSVIILLIRKSSSKTDIPKRRK